LHRVLFYYKLNIKCMLFLRMYRGLSINKNPCRRSFMTITVNNLAAGYTQRGVGSAGSDVKTALANIITGKRTDANASDMVLALGAGRSLASLATVKRNAQEGLEVFRIARTALEAATSELTNMKVLAEKAKTSTVKRTALIDEFKQRVQEYDSSLAKGEFNGIKLLQELASAGTAITNSDATDSRGAIRITFASTSGADTDDLDGFTIYDGTGTSLEINFGTGANAVITGSIIDLPANDPTTAAEKIDALIAIFNGTTSGGTVGSTLRNSLSQAQRNLMDSLSATRDGNDLILKPKNQGVAHEFSIVADAANTDNITTITSGSRVVPQASLATMTTGSDNVFRFSHDSTYTTGSLGRTNVSVTGSITSGNSTIAAIDSTRGDSGWGTMGNLATNLADGSRIRVNGKIYTIEDDVTDATSQIQRDADDDITLSRVVEFLNKKSETELDLANLSFEYRNSSGNLQFRVFHKVATVTSATANDTVAFAVTSAGLTAANSYLAVVGLGTGAHNTAITAGTSVAGTVGGINTAGVTHNPGLVGKLASDAFTVAKTGAGDNYVKVTLKAGDYTYRSEQTQLSVGSSTTVRLYADSDSKLKGGYIDVSMDPVTAITDDATASTFQGKLNDAVKGLTFMQTRQVESIGTNYEAVLGNAVATYTASDFTNTTVDKIDVSYNSTDDESLILFHMGTKLFQAKDSAGTALTGIIKGGQRIVISNQETPAENFEIILSKEVNLTTAEGIKDFQSALTDYFSGGGSALKFQTGLTTEEVLEARIENLSRDALGIADIAIDTEASAIEAVTKIEAAFEAGIDVATAQVSAYIARLRSSVKSLEAIETARKELEALLIASDMLDEQGRLAQASMMQDVAVSLTSTLRQEQGARVRSVFR
jgi:flagellin-like hook-associated protein FlgL